MEYGESALLLALILILLIVLAGLFVLVTLRVIRFIERRLPCMLRAGLTLTPVRRLFASHPEAVASFTRFSRKESYALRLAVGLLASIVFGLIFTEIADELQDKWLISADQAVLAIIYRLRTPVVTDFFLAITFLGSWYFVVLCSLFVVLVLLIARKPFLVFAYSAIISGGGILNQILKAVFTRPRPSCEQITDATG